MYLYTMNTTYTWSMLMIKSNILNTIHIQENLREQDKIC